MLNIKLFPERLKAVREEKNLTVKDLGEMCGTSGATISRYETGVHQPKSCMVEKLAEVLDINPAWLAGANIDRNNEDIIRYDDSNILNRLPEDLREFVINEENTPYLVVAKQLAAYDLSKLTEREMKFIIDWLKAAIEKQ
jgi:transcriptional regulator with XRE-family HTH domain